jgi:hypothetical protein
MKSALLVLRRATLFVAAATMLALVPPATSGASSNPTWTVVSVPGATQTFSVQINDLGVIAGDYINSAGNPVGFIDRGGHYTSISYPGSVGTELSWITDLGVVGGTYYDSDHQNHAFVDVAGKFTSFSDPNAGPLGTSATSESNLGEIVGYYADSNGCSHGFILLHGTFTTLDAPGDPCAYGGTTIDDVNDLGALAVNSFDAPGPSYIYQRGVFTPIVDPSAQPGTTFGSYVTDLGVVGGSYSDASGRVDGFIESHGIYTTLDDPSAGSAPGQGTYLSDGNIFGAIVGYCIDASNNIAAFVLTNH